MQFLVEFLGYQDFKYQLTNLHSLYLTDNRKCFGIQTFHFSMQSSEIKVGGKERGADSD